MYALIPQFLVILSLAGILFIIARKLPVALKIPEEEFESSQISSPFSFVGKFPKIDVSRYQKHLLVIAEKFLRRSVIFSLKIGNLAHQWMRLVKERSEKIPVPYLDELMRERSEESFSDREREYIETIKKNPRNADAYRGLGDLYLEEKNMRDARLSFAEVLKLNPEDEYARTKLEEIGEEQSIESGNEPA